MEQSAMVDGVQSDTENRRRIAETITAVLTGTRLASVRRLAAISCGRGEGGEYRALSVWKHFPMHRERDICLSRHRGVCNEGADCWKMILTIGSHTPKMDTTIFPSLSFPYS